MRDYLDFWQTVVEIARKPKEAEKHLKVFAEELARIESNIDKAAVRLKTANERAAQVTAEAAAKATELRQSAEADAAFLKLEAEKQLRDAKDLAANKGRELADKAKTLNDQEKALRAGEGDLVNQRAELERLIAQNAALKADLEGRLAKLREVAA